MDPDSESLKFVKLGKPVYSKSSQEMKVSDFDSLNNLIFLESDTDSLLYEERIGLKEEYPDDSESVLTKTSTDILCQCLDTNGNSINTKVMFKVELDRHRSFVRKGMRDGSMESEENHKMNSKKAIWRSFISLCIGLMFAFISFMPLRNIQTSLYPMNKLGNSSLACMYFSFAIGCLFSTYITQNVRPKGIILTALFGHVLYCAANVYPSMYTLIPGACFFGFFHAPLWTAQEIILASYGASYSAIAKINMDKAIQQFQGVFLVFCHAAQVFGNLLESAILHCGDYNNRPFNDSMRTSEVLDGQIKIDNITERENNAKQMVWIGPFGYQIHAEVNFPGDKTNYENVIKFVFISFAVIGMTVICLFLNKPDIIINKKKTLFCDRMKELARFIPTGTFLSLFLLMLFSGMQQAVVIGNVTKVKLYYNKVICVDMLVSRFTNYITNNVIILYLVFRTKL
jgi:hypothetical protein